MRKLIIITLALSLYSCDITKQASKTKTDTETNEQYERIEKREGGTATFKPESTIIYRDTTIYVQGTNGTELKVIYDKQGNASQMDCNGALIDIIERYNKQQQETIKEKDKEKTEKPNFDWLLYIVIGIAVVVMLALFLMFIYISRNTKTITSVLDQLKK
jgi:CHASE3 domain sensor protein